MEEFEKQDGIAFLLLYFVEQEEYYYMSFREMKRFWDRGLDGGRKSIRTDEMDPDCFFTGKAYRIPYLDMIQKDLEKREKEEIS